MWRLLKRLAKTAGIPIVMSPHALRHTFATLSRDAGARLEDVQDALGVRLSDQCFVDET